MKYSYSLPVGFLSRFVLMILKLLSIHVIIACSINFQQLVQRFPLDKFPFGTSLNMQLSLYPQAITNPCNLLFILK